VGEAAALMEGKDNSCHLNSAALWASERVAGLATGYALSDDDLWRQHSWGLAADGTVVETTEPRRLYAGLELDPRAAWRFVMANAGPNDVHPTPGRMAMLKGLARGKPTATVPEA
ncbi:hypothetical protein, partial [Streptomyces phyllanthi]